MVGAEAEKELPSARGKRPGWCKRLSGRPWRLHMWWYWLWQGWVLLGWYKDSPSTRAAASVVVARLLSLSCPLFILPLALTRLGVNNNHTL